MLSFRKWHTMKEGVNSLRQMGMAYASTTGSSPVTAAVRTSIKRQLLRGAPASLKPVIIPAVVNATGSVGDLANTLWEIWALISGPSVQVVDKGKPAKQKRGDTPQVTRRQMWNDLLQAGVPRSEINGITTSEMFCQWQKLSHTQKTRLPPAPLPAPRPPTALPAASGQGSAWKMPKQHKQRFIRFPQTAAAVASYPAEERCPCVL